MKRIWVIRNFDASNGFSVLGCFTTVMMFALTNMVMVAPANAQVRSKRPDRGTYQSPRMESVSQAPVEPTLRPVEAEEEVALTSLDQPSPKRLKRKVIHAPIVDPGDDTDLSASQANAEVYEDSVDHYQQSQYEVYEGSEVYEQQGLSCDSYGCDSMGCGNLCNSSLSFCRDQWFGSLELLTMWRSGDRLPSLVTTGADEANADSQTLFGGDTVLKDMTAGGRLTIGTWIDDAQCRSLVLRGWIAGEDDFSFSSNQDQNAILGRPFRNVSDNVAAFDDVRIIASPGRASGSINVDGSSNVFGGDVSVRQFWYGKYGGSVDLLYGYQYMRLDEDLRVSSSTVSLDDDFAPSGSLIGITDSFDTENEFHGGQFGIATHYREACWSFNTLAKVGFGALRRTAKLSGETFTSIDGNNASDAQGLLVRDTNSGTTTDHTFGWVPELDFSLGYHKFPNYELTIGYHIVAMTDALQVSGAIDQNLASNLSDPATGSQRPAVSLQYDTFYVQGIHFGIQYVH